jgi:phage tail protein X
MSRSQKARTDDLVDALVYRLYELTEEKISPHFAVKP